MQLVERCTVLDEFDIVVQIIFNIEFFQNMIAMIIDQRVDMKDLMVNDPSRTSLSLANRCRRLHR